MATPSQPSNQGSGNLSAKDLAKSLKDLIEDQGDYNNLLKNAVSDLKKMDTAYSKVEARLASLFKDTVNIKQANQELLKLRQKEYIEGKKLRDLNKEFSQQTKDELENAKQIANAQKARLGAQGRAFDIEKAMMGILKSKGNVEAVALYAQEKQLELSIKQTQEGEAALITEKQVAKQLGISGNLAKIFAEKLGVGEETYSAMTLKARKLVDENGKITTIGKWKVLAAGIGAAFKAFKDNLKDPAVTAAGIVGSFKLAAKGLDAVGGGAKKAMSAFGAEEGPITKITGNVTSLIKQIPLIGGLLGGVIDSFAMLLDFAIGAKSEFHMMGREIGLSANQSMALLGSLNGVATASGQAALNGKVLLRTYVDINKALEDTNRISSANVVTAYKLQKFAGVELETVAQLEKLSRIMGKSQSSIAGAVMHQVNSFKRLTGFGFSFQSILKEVASLSGYLGLQLAKYPGQMIKSVVAAKGLGLELKQLDAIADSFLDFESSISKEFEAQLLTGKEVNLNKARELFLNNQLLDAGIEITKQIGDANDYLNMNRIAATSYAEQFGMTRDQMGDFLKQQEHLAAFGVGSTKELEKKVALMREQGRAQEAINMLGSEEAFSKYVTASATEDLAGFIEKIKVSLAELVANTGLADMVQNFIGFLSKPENIMKLVNKIRSVFGSIVGVIGTVIGGIMRAINGLAGSWVGEWMGMGGFSIDEGMINMVEGVGDMIKGNNVAASAAPSIGNTKETQQKKKTAATTASNDNKGQNQPTIINLTSNQVLDNRVIASNQHNILVQSPGGAIDAQRMISPNPGPTVVMG
jgi:hypothetical protein